MPCRPGINIQLLQNCHPSRSHKPKMSMHGTFKLLQTYGIFFSPFLLSSVITVSPYFMAVAIKKASPDDLTCLKSIYHSWMCRCTRCKCVATFPRPIIIIWIFISSVHFLCARQFIWIPVRLLAIHHKVFNFIYNTFRVIACGICTLP